MKNRGPKHTHKADTHENSQTLTKSGQAKHTQKKVCNAKLGLRDELKSDSNRLSRYFQSKARALSVTKVAFL